MEKNIIIGRERGKKNSFENFFIFFQKLQFK